MLTGAQAVQQSNTPGERCQQVTIFKTTLPDLKL